MNKATLAIGGVVALAAIWSGGWYAGKSFIVEPEADAAVERLREGSLFFSYDARDIGGFPFAYDVAYRNVSVSNAKGWRWTAPEMSVASGVTDAGALVVTPSDDSKLTIEAAALGGAAEDAPAVFAIASEGMTVTLLGQERFDIDAKAWQATQTTGETLIRDGVLAFTDLDFSGAFTQGGAAGETEMTAATARVAYRLSVDGVSESRSDTKMTGFGATFRGAALDADTLADFLARDGEAYLTMKIESYEGTGGSSGGPSAPPFDLTMTGDETTAEVVLAEGRARYVAAAGAVDYKFEMEGPMPGGALTIGGMTAAFEMPLKKAEDAGPYLMQMRLDDMAISEELWGMFDPAGQLQRTPVDMNIDLGGKARIIFDLGAESFGQPPVDVETLEIRELMVDGLGFNAHATGALDIAGVAANPEGDVHLELRGAYQLIDQLSAAGLLPPGQGEMAKAMAGGFAIQGDGPDHLIADIAIKDGGMTINGKPIQ